MSGSYGLAAWGPVQALCCPTHHGARGVHHEQAAAAGLHSRVSQQEAAMLAPALVVGVHLCAGVGCVTSPLSHMHVLTTCPPRG